MLVILSGMVIEVSDEQFLKQCGPKSIIPSNKVTEVREVQSIKHHDPKPYLTLPGKVIEVREVHSWKHLSSILVTISGILIEVREVQP